MNKREAFRVSAMTMVANIMLAILKLVAGLVAHSGAMISDAVHSASDVFSTIIVIIGMELADKKEDTDHPYGHERIESLAAILLTVVLVATGIGIGYNGLLDIYAYVTGTKTEWETPTALALVAAMVSIVAKEIMYRVTARTAKRVGSDALLADAWHHRTDALSSVGSCIGIAFAMWGFPIMDSVASVVICLFVFEAAFSIAKDSTRKMTDHAVDTDTQTAVRRLILAQEGIVALRMLKTRQFGARVYMDVIVTADPSLSFARAHSLAEQVHDEIERAFPIVKGVMVHIEPDENAQGRPVFVRLNKHWYIARHAEHATVERGEECLVVRFPLCELFYEEGTAYEGVLTFHHPSKYDLQPIAAIEDTKYWEYGVEHGCLYRIENETQDTMHARTVVQLARDANESQHYFLSLPIGFFECRAEGFSFAIREIAR